MLIGQYSGTIGVKRRLAIPKKLVGELGSTLIVAKWYEKCLVLVSSESWAQLLIRLTGGSKLITEPVRDIDRFILGSAFELDLDGQGRVVVPETLMEYAGLGQDVTFLGLGDRVEIWSSKVWMEKEEKIMNQAHRALEKLAIK